MRAWRAGLLVAAGLGIAAQAALASLAPGRLAILDAFADPFGLGHFGALLSAEAAGDPVADATPLSSSGDFYQASDLAFRADRSIVLVDRDADPSGHGADPNGDPGPGAVFVADAVTGALSVLADGSVYPAGRPPGVSTMFVDPRGIAVADDGVTALVADTDADPSGLGADSAGFAGHGALFAVDASGALRLVSDGTLSDDGPPPRGAASWLEDPGAACVASDGSVYLLDIFGDPLATGGRGAVFSVDLASGRLRLVAVSALFAAPTGIAELAPGRLVVSDQLVNLRGDGSRGALFEIDLGQPDPVAATSVLATDPRFRGPAGVGAAADGSVFFADPFANPLGLGRIGATFRLRPSGEVSVASAAAQYLAPVSVRVTPPGGPAPSLVSVNPGSAEVGETVQVTLSGAGFDAPGEARFGPGVLVTDLRILSATLAEAELEIDAGAVPGLRHVDLVNPDLQLARLTAGFEVLAPLGPEPVSVEPPAGIQGTVVDLIVRGDRFEDGATLDLGADLLLAPVTWISTSELRTRVDIAALATPGLRDLVVTNPGGLSGRLVAAFEVLLPAPPAITTFSPSSLRPGRGADVVVEGTSFVPGMSLDLGAGIVVGPGLVESAFRARFRVFTRSDASPGSREAIVSNPDGRSGSLSAATTVADEPALRLVAVLVDDSAGNRSGWADPAEPLALDVIAWSEGPRAMAAASLRISVAPDAGAQVVRGSVLLGADGPGLLRRPAPPLPELLLDASIACGSRVAVRVEIVEAGVSLLDEIIEIPVGAPGPGVRKPEIVGANPGARAGEVVELGDLDGDGWADLVAGAPRDSPSGVFAAGRVSAVSSATDDPLWTLEGSVIDEHLGSALAVVGDINGDGAEDLVVGAPGALSGAGRISLVDGRTGGVLATREGAAGERLGARLARLGDRDLDGLPEILAGMPSAAGGAGRALILSLPDLEVRDTLDGAPGDELGWALADAGDLDGDGRADAAVGAPGMSAGRVLLWMADSSLTVLDGAAPGERFGAALASGADADFDGFPDLLVAAPAADTGSLVRAGRVEWISGRDLSRRILPGDEAGAEMGTALAFVGDLDGDGRAEAAVGAPGSMGGRGAVELRDDALAPLRRELGLGQPGDLFGASLAAGPRALGDAHADLAIGAPRQGVPGTALAGRAILVRSLPACQPFVPCLADAWEPNPPGSPSLVTWGTHGPLTVCPRDIDAFQIDLPVARRALVRVAFEHVNGDLDATLHDATGVLVEQSLSVDDDEELGPFGPGGTWEIRVFGYDGASNDYELHVLDPDTCVPAAEITGLRAARSGERTLLTWQPSVDPCHVGYRIWQAPVASGTPGPPFPAGTSFVDVSLFDLDGDLANPAHESDSTGPAFWLVSDIGRTGDGASGWGPSR